ASTERSGERRAKSGVLLEPLGYLWRSPAQSFAGASCPACLLGMAMMSPWIVLSLGMRRATATRLVLRCPGSLDTWLWLSHASGACSSSRAAERRRDPVATSPSSDRVG